MEPEILSLDGEALEEFKRVFDLVLKRMVVEMEEKDLATGTVTGKIKVEMSRTVDANTGEMRTFVEMKPDVRMKMSEGGGADCNKVQPLQLHFTASGEPVVGTRQERMAEAIA